MDEKLENDMRRIARESLARGYQLGTEAVASAFQTEPRMVNRASMSFGTQEGEKFKGWTSPHSPKAQAERYLAGLRSTGRNWVLSKAEAAAFDRLGVDYSDFEVR